MSMHIIDKARQSFECTQLSVAAYGHINAQYVGCARRLSTYGRIAGIPRAIDLFPKVRRSDWLDRIRAEAGTFLQDLTAGILPPHNQGRTNYCWAHGSVRAVEMSRIFTGQVPLLLSAESVAVPVTGGRNRGGSPDEALQRLRSHGACPADMWPANDLNQRHATANWETAASDNAIITWCDIRDWEDQITLGFHRIPVPIGLGWWSHLVCQLGPIELPGEKVGICFDNSHGPDYGENGRAILDEESGTADLGAFAPVSDTHARTL